MPLTNSEAADAPASTPPLPALSGDDLLLWSALPDLTLNIAQTASLCGVSVRQLGYWTKQGYITASGRGARRLYGPDALRRILAIRHAMKNGLSLRQSLRALDDGSLSLVPPASSRPALSPAAAQGSPLSPDEVEALASHLLGLFDGNKQTRDNAAGLAVKLGRGAADVRGVAEHLASQGALTRSQVGDEVVYARAGGLP